MTSALTRRAYRWLQNCLFSLFRSHRRGAVCWTPDFMGFGNVLYVLHWVATLRENGSEAIWALETDASARWLPIFPELAPLLVRRENVGLFQARLMPWSQGGRAALPEHLIINGVPRDEERPYESFIYTYLMPGTVRAMKAMKPTPPETLVVNVRRGDYYSDEDNRRNFGFPIATYLQTAVPAAIDTGGPVDEILVVSDDPDWCRVNLAFLADYAPRMVVSDRSSGPVGDFFQMVAARRLVMTNSTFSYWAAMVGNVIHGDNHALIWAPRFFDRSQHGGRSVLVDERWSIVEEIPRGWELDS